MKIIVTGCAGFIGSHFSEMVLTQYPGDMVIGVDCLTYAASTEALSKLCGYKSFHFYKANICDIEAMEMIFATEKPDMVVNFAAETHVDNSIANSRPFVETNVIGAQILLDASLKHGVKHFHQISTDEVYGDLPLDSKGSFSEDSPLNPSSPYSASKAAADLLALSYSRTHGLAVSVSRCTNNFGTHQHGEKLIPTVIRHVINGTPVPIYGNGSNRRDWLYVTDHCHAVDMIIRAGKCGVYNIGAGNECSNLDLVNRIIAMLNIPDAKIEFVTDRKGHDRRYSVCSDKIRHELGWQPEADFESELKATVEWYRGK